MNDHPFNNASQSVRRVKEANADMRCLSVKLPVVHEDGTTREVWWYVFVRLMRACMRACVYLWSCDKYGSIHFAFHSQQPTHSPRTEHERTRASPSSEVDKAASLKLVNKMPEWNEGMHAGVGLHGVPAF